MFFPIISKKYIRDSLRGLRIKPVTNVKIVSVTLAAITEIEIKPQETIRFIGHVGNFTIDYKTEFLSGGKFAMRSRYKIDYDKYLTMKKEERNKWVLEKAKNDIEVQNEINRLIKEYAKENKIEEDEVKYEVFYDVCSYERPEYETYTYTDYVVV